MTLYTLLEYVGRYDYISWSDIMIMPNDHNCLMDVAVVVVVVVAAAAVVIKCR